MKRAIFIVLLCSASFSFYSCGINADTKNHTHSDGSRHAEQDTTKSLQETFNAADTLNVDTTRADTSSHTHENGEKHSH